MFVCVHAHVCMHVWECICVCPCESMSACGCVCVCVVSACVREREWMSEREGRRIKNEITQCKSFLQSSEIHLQKSQIPPDCSQVAEIQMSNTANISKACSPYKFSSILPKVNCWTGTVKWACVLCTDWLWLQAPAIDLFYKHSLSYHFILSYTLKSGSLKKVRFWCKIQDLRVPHRRTMHKIRNRLRWIITGQWELNWNTECSWNRNWMKSVLVLNILPQKSFLRF
jgi:hypothetical protein